MSGWMFIKTHWQCLSDIKMPHPVQQIVLQECNNAVWVCNEQMMEKHLDFLKDTKQVDSTPSGKEGVLWTNAFLK